MFIGGPGGVTERNMANSDLSTKHAGAFLSSVSTATISMI
jgi:hypothetical protein